jgi:hypothetical protein
MCDLTPAQLDESRKRIMARMRRGYMPSQKTLAKYSIDPQFVLDEINEKVRRGVVRYAAKNNLVVILNEDTYGAQ